MPHQGMIPQYFRAFWPEIQQTYTRELMERRNVSSLSEPVAQVRSGVPGQETARAIVLHLSLIFHPNLLLRELLLGWERPQPPPNLPNPPSHLPTAPPTLFPLICSIEAADLETRKISRLSASRRTKGDENGNFFPAPLRLLRAVLRRSRSMALTLSCALLISAAPSAGFPLAPLLPFIGSFSRPRHSGSHRPAESLTPE